MNKKHAVTALILLAAIISAFFMNERSTKSFRPTSHDLPEKTNLPAVEEMEAEFDKEVTIAAIGDILIHDTVYMDAANGTEYDFHPMFAPFRKWLQQPDFLIANQESIPGGDELGISTYPRFNSPQSIVDALMDAGVDMVTGANNHTLDKGPEGILGAIGYYEQKGLPYAGLYKSPDDQEKIRYVDVNEIKIAVLAYAEHFNGLSPPPGKEYMVSELTKERVLSDIKKAKENADAVILSLHWGDEYVRSPNTKQQELADDFIQGGADVIFGHHPHVLQPMELINREEGSAGLVVYSLGNFLSGQIRDGKDIGGMAEVTLRKKTGVKRGIVIQDVAFHPTFTSSRQFRDYRVYPMDEAFQKGLTDTTGGTVREFMKIPDVVSLKKAFPAQAK